jgi:hypothetical protein
MGWLKLGEDVNEVLRIEFKLVLAFKIISTADATSEMKTMWFRFPIPGAMMER